MQKSFSGRSLRGTLFFAGLRGAKAAARLPDGRKTENVIQNDNCGDGFGLWPLEP